MLASPPGSGGGTKGGGVGPAEGGRKKEPPLGGYRSPPAAKAAGGSAVPSFGSLYHSLPHLVSYHPLYHETNNQCDYQYYCLHAITNV